MATNKSDKNKDEKVFVGISGGVDSAVAALLLKKQGYKVTGIFMRLWREEGSALEKKLEEEEINAKRIAETIGIDFLVWNLEKEFKKKVVNYFLKEYCFGRTPNPCVRCNRDIKFGLFLDRAFKEGAEFVATGHYARIKKEVSKNPTGKKIIKYKLLKAKDNNKDQSYFLYNLNKNKLKRIIFPLGDYTKEEVRRIAKKEKLFIHSETESQEICFVGEKYYGDFIKRQGIEIKGGKIFDEYGKILGEHRGLPFYTIGQRRDIRVGGTGPYFVIGFDYKNNYLIVSRNFRNKKLFARKFAVCDINWTRDSDPKFPLRVKVKIRYRMKEIPAMILKEGGEITVELDYKSRAVTLGQSAVFYKRGEVLGGGIINKIKE